MISLTNYDFQWARSELVIIYPRRLQRFFQAFLQGPTDALSHLHLQGVPEGRQDRGMLKMLGHSLWET